MHCTRGAGIWDWASNDEGGEPDVVMACCGDVPTLETLAAVSILRERAPGAQGAGRQRRRPDAAAARHASIRTASPMREFDSLFTQRRPVVFAYHGYPWLIHRLTYRRTNHANLHVRGYKEEGTTTTPFDMVMLNDLDRFHLVMDVVDRVPGPCGSRRARAPADGRSSGWRPRLYPRARRRRSRRPRLDVARLSDVLVVNAGSTSLKLRVVDGGRAVDGRSSRSRGAEQSRRWRIGVVHGGDRVRRPAVIDDAVARRSEELVALAPLHKEPALDAIVRARESLPGVPTSPSSTPTFHGTLPEPPRPTPCRADGGGWGIRRYGFHGLSVAWSAERVRVPRLVVCHLGGGCSVTAVLDGRSVDTTMGFTPLDGVPMSTRSGSVDPGVLLYLLRRARPGSTCSTALEHESGLSGLAGTDDVAAIARRRTIRLPGSRSRCSPIASRRRWRPWPPLSEGSTRSSSPPAIGEHAAPVREQVAALLTFLGEFQICVVSAREDVVAARAARGATAM